MIKDLIKNNKKTIIIILLIILIGGIAFIITTSNNSNNKYKKVNNMNYVITIKEFNDLFYCPQINIDNKKIDEINQELLNKFYLVKENKYNQMNYTYTINDNILSLLVKIIKIEGDYNTEVEEFMSYNIDLDTGKLLKNNELLSLYKLKENDIIDLLNNEFLYTYNNFTYENIIEPDQCDYECFKQIQELDYNNLNLYVNEDNKIIGYLNYNIFTYYFDSGNNETIKNKYKLN